MKNKLRVSVVVFLVQDFNNKLADEFENVTEKKNYAWTKKRFRIWIESSKTC